VGDTPSIRLVLPKNTLVASWIGPCRLLSGRLRRQISSESGMVGDVASPIPRRPPRGLGARSGNENLGRLLGEIVDAERLPDVVLADDGFGWQTFQKRSAECRSSARHQAKRGAAAAESSSGGWGPEQRGGPPRGCYSTVLTLRIPALQDSETGLSGGVRQG